MPREDLSHPCAPAPTPSSSGERASTGAGGQARAAVQVGEVLASDPLFANQLPLAFQTVRVGPPGVPGASPMPTIRLFG